MSTFANRQSVHANQHEAANVPHVDGRPAGLRQQADNCISRESARSLPPSRAALAGLQADAGNVVVQRLFLPGALDLRNRSAPRPIDQGGRPLEAGIRGKMEARFGRDFSTVRIHTGAEAESSASDFAAKAYAAGRNVVFGAGAYAPGTRDGDRVLAHELAHVVQQSERPQHVPPTGNVLVSDPDDAGEQAAVRAAADVSGRTVPVSASVSPPVPTGAATVQRFVPPGLPDLDWLRKTGGDIVGTGVNAVEAVPGIGNAISTVGAATMGAAGLGASALGYDEFAKTMYSGAEYNALNALPVVGNIRAAKAAAQDVGAVAGDLQGKPPEQNPSAQNDWEEGGQQKFNESAGGLWDSYWQ